ncbi:amidohydrolase [Aliishimia ponticola]|uniref:Amidohydrolase n=2 Tax=Aliishimia ponticola TaxID=2499833 RepID=A0A4S4NLI1_9RHOB|nr:amidohydrolase [Aliishimia ponticola]
MIRWRHDLHRHPEFGFEETRTAAFVAETLRAFGFEVATGIGGTGVVGSLQRGTSNRAVALRADMDCLKITEATGAAHASQSPGLMHACGHDGHTALLLGAGQMLAQDGGFDGTVRLIFQPAEEWGRGALAMLDDGLMQRFPFDEIYGLHNMPGLPVGHVQTCAGAIMAAEDLFDVTLTGAGGHAARPHMTREVMVPACALVMALQSIVARRIDPVEAAVVSVTEIETDGARNILPGHARVAGDARSFSPEVSAKIEADIRACAAAIAAQYGIAADVSYAREFVPLVNDHACTAAFAEAAEAVSRDVDVTAPPISASEDFAQFLQHVPGAFAFFGNGEESAPLHSPHFDFNDDALAHGAALMTAIVRARLPG